MIAWVFHLFIHDSDFSGAFPIKKHNGSVTHPVIATRAAASKDFWQRLRADGSEATAESGSSRVGPLLTLKLMLMTG